MKRFFIYLSYNGTHYCGWQNQPNGMSVQQKVEEALSLLLRNPVSIIGAGRTDAGVHARLMVAHFDWEDENFVPEVLSEKLNRILPKDIAVEKIVRVSPEAHARFDAISRTYQYYLTCKKNPFDYPFRYKIGFPLDFNRMNDAAQILLEYRDFTSFSKLHTDVKTNRCRIIQAGWQQEAEVWVFTIRADRFLRNMVRAIVGTLLDVGRGKLSLTDFREIIESKDRSKAGSSAPGNALFLTEIEYAKEIMNYEL
jgi:tRNA pseudouridine38-40 synthase